MSEINISIAEGTSKRLLTAGKYCDKNIVVSANGSQTHDVKLHYYDYNAIHIPNYLFQGVFSIDGVYIDPIASVEFRRALTVGMYAFSGHTSLKSVKMPVVEEIQDGAFQNTGLTQIDFRFCKYILKEGFAACESLESVNLLSLEETGASAFSDCPALKKIYLPSLIYVSFGAFAGCTALTDVEFPKAHSVADEAFYECSALSNVNIPSAVRVGTKTFEKCTSLTKLDLPMVTSIGADAFAGCTNLSTVILRTTSTVCVAELSAFTGTPMLTGWGHIYVPDAMYEYYRAGYEATLNTLMPGFFDILFRKIEDYPEICGKT